MNWKDCVRQNEFYAIRSRFEWPVGEGKSGFDCNDAFTVNDALGAISWIWTWPGDYLLNLPQARAFFELTPETVIGSGWSSALPFVLYPMILLLLAWIMDAFGR